MNFGTLEDEVKGSSGQKKMKEDNAEMNAAAQWCSDTKAKT